MLVRSTGAHVPFFDEAVFLLADEVCAVISAGCLTTKIYRLEVRKTLEGK